jgi:ABC-2 type transport system ATP-binding protein
VAAPQPIALDSCSKWYGQVLGISDVTWSTDGGVIGLLGPNGAGKSTFIKLLAGLLRPSRGKCTVFGASTFFSIEARRRVGYSPEHEGAYDDLTGLELVTALAELSGVPRGKAGATAAGALDRMGMAGAMNRRVKGYSKGMRQRTKLAQATVHDPDVLLLDEPLTGVDPLARKQIIDQVRALGAAGKTVIVSSHVLHEIQALTQEILVIYRGQVLAEGNVLEIRALIDQHPHRIRVDCERPRDVARAVIGAEHVVRTSFDDGSVVIETRDPDACYDLIGSVVVDEDIPIRSLTSPDNSLGAVFEYLTTRKGSGAP